VKREKAAIITHRQHRRQKINAKLNTTMEILAAVFFIAFFLITCCRNKYPNTQNPHNMDLPQTYRIAEICPETRTATVVREGFRMTLTEAIAAAKEATHETGIRHRPCLVKGDHTFVCLVS